MTAPNLPFELCELILEGCSSLQDVSRLAQTTPAFNNVWLNAVSRRRICEKIAVGRVSHLVSAKYLADLQMGPLAVFKPELELVTEKVRRVLDISRQADYAAKLFEEGALRCLPRCNPNDAIKPHRLLPVERERFLTTYLQQWTVACTPPADRLAYVRSLPQDELLRLEDLAYWLASLSARDRLSLQHDTKAWDAAFAALHERNKHTLGTISTHWIFLNSQRRQMAAFEALINSEYDVSSGFARTVSLGSAAGGIAAA